MQTWKHWCSRSLAHCKKPVFPGGRLTRYEYRGRSARSPLSPFLVRYILVFDPYSNDCLQSKSPTKDDDDDDDHDHDDVDDDDDDHDDHDDVDDDEDDDDDHDNDDVGRST